MAGMVVNKKAGGLGELKTEAGGAAQLFALMEQPPANGKMGDWREQGCSNQDN